MQYAAVNTDQYSQQVNLYKKSAENKTKLTLLLILFDEIEWQFQNCNLNMF